MFKKTKTETYSIREFMAGKHKTETFHRKYRCVHEDGSETNTDEWNEFEGVTFRYSLLILDTSKILIFQWFLNI